MYIFNTMTGGQHSHRPTTEDQSLLPVTSWLGAFPVPGNFVSDYIIYYIFKSKQLWCHGMFFGFFNALVQV
jgi:hypothetical protein